MRRFVKVVTLALFLAGGLAATPASAACKTDPIMFDFTNHMQTNIQVGMGEYCAGDFKLPAVNIDQIQVVNQPARGLVSVDQKSFVWRYRPFKGFRGTDRFILRVYGTKKGVRSDGTVVFNVTVR